jgi:L-alanine-DL-glutamate epimerase-like enolase superfamily enzyme
MNRRDWLKTTVAAAGAAALPVESLAALAQEQHHEGAGAQVTMEIKRLKLRHTWTTTMASDDFRDTLHLRLTFEGITGIGEGAPIIRYKENAVGAQKAVQTFLAGRKLDPCRFDSIMAEFEHQIPGEHAAKAALEIALMDWVGQKLKVPVYKYLGLNPAETPVTTFTIGMDTAEVVKQKTLEAAPYPVLKVKVGPNVPDEQMINTIRSVTDKPLRVDANEGWTNKEDVVRKIEWLQTKNVEFMEQPMPASVPLEDIRWIRERVSMPLIADEACTEAKMIPRCCRSTTAST